MSTKQNAIGIFRAALPDYGAEEAFKIAQQYAAKFDKAYPETPLTQVPPLPWRSLADGVPEVGQGCYVTVWGFGSITRADFGSVTRADWVGDPDGGNDFYWGPYRVFGDIFSPLEFADRVIWCDDNKFSNIHEAMDSLLAARTAFVFGDE